MKLIRYAGWAPTGQASLNAGKGREQGYKRNDRLKQIIARCSDGDSYANIARDYGITRQRVQRIVSDARKAGGADE